MSATVLSIVIPVFGVEKYIKEFLDSLMHQNRQDIEIIFVNDGTKDNSIDILEAYLSDEKYFFDNVSLYHQSNQGQSVARNFGISLSQGEYVTFLDPDDLVAENYIYKILEVIKKYKPDIVNFNASSFYGNKKRNLMLCDVNYVGPVSEKNLHNIFEKCMWFSWLRVFKRSLLPKDFFEIGVNYQDMISIPRYYFKCNNMVNMVDELVLYRIHTQSSVNSFKPKLIVSAEKGIDKYCNYENNLEFLIYSQFIKLRLNLGFNNLGFIKTTSWFLKYYSKFGSHIFLMSYFELFTISFIKKIIGYKF